MIRLSGREPGEDIAIEFTGARARREAPRGALGRGRGGRATTPHPQIRRARRPPVEAAWLDGELVELEQLVEDGDTLGLVSRLSQTVGAPVRTEASLPASSVTQPAQS